MAKVIALFNHKGGVSKTTTTFNLGWMLAKKNQKVLIVDADPQCNLTGTVVGLDESENFYEKGLGRVANVYKLLEHSIIKGRGQQIPDVALYSVPKNDNLFLLAGSQEIAEIEAILSVALKTSAALSNMSSFPGIIGKSIREIARRNNIDIVLLDMSPSIGAFNECLLMSSDYFIVPTSPDFYCYQAITSLAKKIPLWNDEMKKFRQNDIDIPMQQHQTKFIGIISQRYRPRQDAAIKGRDTTKAFRIWIDKINEKVRDVLVPALSNMSITREEFIQNFANESPFNIIDIPEFNTLIARSHDTAIPIFELTESELLTGGYAQQTQLQSVEKFKEIFDRFATGVINCIANL
jgi:chromosome partitioning protein